MGVAAPHPSGHGAAHALLQRGEFRETGLAEKSRPAIDGMTGRERRPSLVVIFCARLKSIHSGAGFYSFIFAPSFFAVIVRPLHILGAFIFNCITAYSFVIGVSCSLFFSHGRDSHKQVSKNKPHWRKCILHLIRHRRCKIVSKKFQKSSFLLAFIHLLPFEGI